jgi:hypothetical protein
MKTKLPANSSKSIQRPEPRVLKSFFLTATSIPIGKAGATTPEDTTGLKTEKDDVINVFSL